MIEHLTAINSNLQISLVNALLKPDPPVTIKC